MADSEKGKEDLLGRNLVLMFDGTWNVRGNWTNVARMFEAVDRVKEVPTEYTRWKADNFHPDGEPKPRDGERVQLVKYITGVGTHETWRKVSSLAGAMWGYGLSQIMLEGYLWLSENYRTHDRIFVFGFSRGAFTARALVSLLHMCRGVLKLDPKMSDAAKKKLLETAYDLYTKRNESKKDNDALKQFGLDKCRRVRVKMVGVWDTVGALGVPDSLSNITPTWYNAPIRWGLSAMMTQIQKRNYYRFFNQGLPCIVDEAYHALAIDEHRVDFLPSLWNKRKQLKPHDDDEALGIVLPKEQIVEQCWFVGSHCNVGGGVDNDLDPEDLWQLSYEWMQQKAENAGLRFKWHYNSNGNRWRWLREVENSFELMGNGFYKNTHTRVDRAIIREKLSMAGGKAESLHWSVKLRMENDPKYRPPALESHPKEFGYRFQHPLKAIDGADFVPALVEDDQGKKYHTEIPFEPMEEIEYCSCREEWTERKKVPEGPAKEKSVYVHPLVLQNLQGKMPEHKYGKSESDHFGRNGSQNHID
ncbi:hypothetical protein M758_1G149600 [Ceratodon purpureus]|uniref:T6SS Phospholipase effector Tle1-like catalytic domain-containing protein n=1 Tax=Ceratodon purpureus TaxID=3225 RepID=A0A8T0J5G9_CERPU|nr:hypothetical protein KC19_1G152600 [Ceratodon purpureus]KAG0630037.1 hypothetical protein M758_1G149600 [Ceratodon purpureus]